MLSPRSSQRALMVRAHCLGLLAQAHGRGRAGQKDRVDLDVEQAAADGGVGEEHGHGEIGAGRGVGHAM